MTVPSALTHTFSPTIAVRGNKTRGRLSRTLVSPILRTARHDPSPIQHLRAKTIDQSSDSNDYQPDRAAGQREIALGSLCATRDLSDVSDTAAGFVMTASCDAAIGQTIQLGKGFETSTGDLAQRIVTLMNADVTIREDQRPVRCSN